MSVGELHDAVRANALCRVRGAGVLVVDVPGGLPGQSSGAVAVFSLQLEGGCQFGDHGLLYIAFQFAKVVVITFCKYESWSEIEPVNMNGLRINTPGHSRV
ncbi:hypothetical protein D3C84_794690 [compost metagenome]